MTPRAGDTVTYQPRGKGTRKRKARVQRCEPTHLWVVGPHGFAAIRYDAVRDVRRDGE